MAADGSIWVTGLHPDGDYHVSVSRDRGHSWLDGSPSHVDDVDRYPIGMVHTYDGQTGYFVWSLSSDAGPVSTQIYRTTDGGKTWHSLPAELPFEGEPAGLWVTPNGVVMVEDAHNAYLSPDGAEPFDKLEQEVPLQAGPIRGGFHTSWLDVYTDAVSEDGLAWRGLEHPSDRDRSRRKPVAPVEVEAEGSGACQASPRMTEPSSPTAYSATVNR